MIEHPPAPPTGRPAITLTGVSKRFDTGTLALDGLNLRVAEGEFLSLLGPSGCGKSTALRLIAGLAEPSSGTVTREAGASEIGFVFQEPTLMPWATAFGNVWMPLRLKGVGRRQARDPVMEALERVGLQDFAGAYPRELSGGMKMRVSIARALVGRPKILLMDEPFAALDEITRFRLNDELLELWRKAGWTGVFVTHSVFESVFLSQRVAILSARPGHVVEELEIDEPYPRDEGFRTSPSYAHHCRAVSHALRRATVDIRAA
ncbi:ABC-type nitrate/sulfonate/bicarbonate transport system, ATPase component [Lutibaculum baratangense AMV1]|uniref:ABC-type nitrate/sulfonate/bicarbonate transport system, ATPase component n=1 Tax=Lutibaculum baratangense AMV1 TaxID=631454 RepID=V4TK20_9HYPH|nr:ABC-type nitrate/sulfonate/bicarbonate transport system, ATPase component [Lutibaculum baratangense AMV1]